MVKYSNKIETWQCVVVVNCVVVVAVIVVFVVRKCTSQCNPVGYQLSSISRFQRTLAFPTLHLIALQGDLLPLGTFLGHVTHAVLCKGRRGKVYPHSPYPLALQPFVPSLFSLFCPSADTFYYSPLILSYCPLYLFHILGDGRGQSYSGFQWSA